MSSLLSYSPNVAAFLTKKLRNIWPTLQGSRSLSVADTMKLEQDYVSSSEPMTKLQDRDSVLKQCDVSSSEPMTKLQDQESVKTESPSRQFMKSVTIPLQAQDRLVQHSTHIVEFKIDYKVRLDKNGHDSVYKVCMPSRYKGWATIAEKDPAASPVVKDLPAKISVGHPHLKQ